LGREVWRLRGDGDLARLGLLLLGNDNGEQAVLHGSSDMVLVDTRWECEASAEVADAAFRDPELGFGLLVVLLGLGGLVLGDLGGSTLSTLIFDGSLVCLVVAVATFDGTLRGTAFDEASWWSAGRVVALGAALDGQGMGVRELDLNVLLLDSREFAVEFVGILEFLHVELGSEGLHGGVNRAGIVTLAAVLVEVVEHTEEWLEGIRRVGGEEGSWEERHFAFWCCWFECCWSEESSSEWKS
jgi:hypothetical protein